VFLHPAGKMRGAVSVGSVEVWSGEQDGGAGDPSACPPTGNNVVTFNKVIQHTGSVLGIDAKGLRTGGASEPSFAMYLVSIKPITLGTGPWRTGKSDFTTSTDSWFGPGMQQRTACNAPLSATILGGDKTNAQVDQAYKVYSDIPEHSGLSIRMKFHYIKWGTPEYMGEILVDDQRIWAKPYSEVAPEAITQACGYTVGTEDVFYYLSGHSLPTVKVSVRTTGSVHTHMHFGISDVEIVLHQKCSAGEYESAAPTRDHDRECKLLTVCKPTQFEFSSPNAVRDRGCRDCSMCTPGFTTQTACTATTDAVCKRCDACTAGTWEEQKCSDSAPTTKCTKCSVCKPAEFQAAACGSAADTKCIACSATCRSGQYIAIPCTGVADRTCANVTVCTATEFEIQAPTSSTDRFCRALSSTCDATQWEIKKATPTSDRVCVSATPACNIDAKTDSGEQEYELAPLTASSDRVCRKCTICPTTQKQTKKCQPKADTTCGKCEVCTAAR